jgi:hypothetical protein
MPFLSVSTSADMFKSDDHIAKLKKDVLNFQKVIYRNPERLLALADSGVVSGHQIDPECCASIPDDILRRIAHDTAILLLEGNAKLNGKTNNWSVGGFGSVWMDLDAKKYGLDHIRLAYYSKATSTDGWTWAKPILIRITAEKSK